MTDRILLRVEHKEPEHDGEVRLDLAIALAIVVVIAFSLGAYFLGQRAGEKEASARYGARIAQLQGKLAASERYSSLSKLKTVRPTRGANREMIPVGVEEGNTFSKICMDLYGIGTKAAYSAAAKEAASVGSSALPYPEDPDTIIAGQTLWLPLSITVDGQVYKADVARAKRLSLEREERQDAMAQSQAHDASDAMATAGLSQSSTAAPTTNVAAQHSLQLPLASATLVGTNMTVRSAAIGVNGSHAPPSWR